MFQNFRNIGTKHGLINEKENTRLRKNSDGSFDVLIASAVTNVPTAGGDIGKETEFEIDDGSLKGHKLKLAYGDYSNIMKLIASYHKRAAENAENDNQKNMQFAYAKSFEEGSLEAFKNSQRFWIRDKGPMVESNIGFVETYRDPHGVRGEWEGSQAAPRLSRLTDQMSCRIRCNGQFGAHESIWGLSRCC